MVWFRTERHRGGVFACVMGDWDHSLLFICFCRLCLHVWWWDFCCLLISWRMAQDEWILWLLSLHEQSADTQLGLSFQSAMPKVATSSLASSPPTNETLSCIRNTWLSANPPFSPKTPQLHNSYFIATHRLHQNLNPQKQTMALMQFENPY